ncbi:NAD-dependent, hopanoid-associated epimerase/dehydratase family acting on nucleotide-sugars [hydrothermal vent metagenome]|uniref:NAD-dependent, hopanoid-associated epimerase/dehydratase family acting on nucleotide-sugars n=1 Tax=hydrothermal vent metagenome TaxID=652676 RepID=A0A3B0SGU2_9ZZZZ
MTKKQAVLITGATGFIAKHCILRLLEAGYQVRGSVRSMRRADALKRALGNHMDVTDLSFVELDLMSDTGWADAVQGCKFVLHVASPFPATEPEHEDELIIPAREGALRALRFSADAGVKRVVLTSSMSAIAYGDQSRDPGPFTEKDWTNTETRTSAYIKSKTMAERAAWEFINSEAANGMELSVINPGAVLGPLLDKTWSTSGELVRRLVAREMPACPRISFSCIDVRDVAEAHYQAMIRPEAAGERFLVAAPSAWIVDISKALAANGYNSPTKILPGFLVKLVGVFDKSIRMISKDLNQKKEISNAKLRTVLQIEPRSLEEMSVSMAKSMQKYEVV